MRKIVLPKLRFLLHFDSQLNDLAEFPSFQDGRGSTTSSIDVAISEESTFSLQEKITIEINSK